MSAAAKAKRAELVAALTGLQPHGIRYTALGDDVDPPAAVVGPPLLNWESYSAEPTSARYLVYLIVGADERAIDRLLDLMPLVTEAIESVPDASVTLATPTVWPAGELPCYELTVEATL